MGMDIIILDVAKGDFDHKLPKQERWQQQAETSLLHALESTAKHAKEYKNKRDADKLCASRS